MKVLLSWIQEYLDLDLPPKKIEEALTLAGLEGEGIEEIEDDVVFEIGLTPNLGHCMSILGIARELSAILNIPLKRKRLEFDEFNEKTSLSVTIKNTDSCSKYSCRIVKDVKIAPSPDWLKKRLEACGLRSINNAVDIGNYVMLELGQPLHMFDFDKLQNKSIRVDLSNNNESMTTLDDVERKIPNGALVIYDGKNPVALAGVIGGKESAVSDSSSSVLIESAYFSPEIIRKSSKLLNLRSESSLRFERGIDFLGVDPALDMAAHLLQSVAGGKIVKGPFGAVCKEYSPRQLEMCPDQANRILGTHLSLREMATLLGRLEIEVLLESEDVIRVQIPSYRNDLKSEIDLIEEIGRMFGFNNIPRSIPRHASSTISHAPLYLFEEEVRAKLVAQGLQECLTCDLISPKLANLSKESSMGEDAQIHVLYPASLDQSVLRTSLLPGLLEVIKFNLDHQNSTVAAYEVGHIHFKNKDQFFVEPAAGIVLTGRNAPYHFETKPDVVDFFDLKGHVEDLLAALGIPRTFAPSHLHAFHPGRQAQIFSGHVEIGALGEVLPKHLRELGIDQRVLYAELNLHVLLNLKKKEIKIIPPPNFPGSNRDWTITLDQKMQIGPLLKMIKDLDSPLLEDVHLLDIYKSEKLATETMNATLRFSYRDRTKTVEYEDVEKEHKRITEYIAQKFKDGVL